MAVILPSTPSSALNTLSPSSFTTFPVANVQLSTYSLAIRSPGIAGFPYLTYSFPMSPQNIRKDVTSMTAIYDVEGPAVTNGVTRLVDSFGNAPPMFSIEGTTGWQRHNADLYQYTGLQSAYQIEKLLSKYASLNRGQIEKGLGNSLYTLEFWDDFRQDYYQVEPVGEQGIKQSAAQPLLVHYSFRLAAVRPLHMPLLSALARQLFSQAAPVAMRATLSVVGPVLSGY